jgi:glycosyltransferase involved in cell wall biosynthesis
MKIAFIYAKGREQRYAFTVKGHAASEFFYGALELERSGHLIARYELGHGDCSETKLWHKIAEQLYRWRMTPTRTNSVILAELYEICPELNKNDIIVATTTAAAFGLAVLKFFGLVKCPVVAIHCGIVNFQLAWPRRKLNAYALKNSWTQLFGEGELADVKKFYNIPDSRIEVNQFGVDTEFWKPASSDEGYILSVGNDERRDYELLIQVAREVNLNFKIVTRRTIEGDIPPNVEIIKGGWHEQSVTDEDLRSLYQKASIVVIPLKNSPQPSGQSVCLQAMACSKPVILTRTNGLWSDEMMRDNVNVKFVPPENAAALISAINHLSRNHKERDSIGLCARETVIREGNIEAFAERLSALCLRVTNLTKD